MDGIAILSARGLVEAHHRTIMGIVWSFGDQNPAKGFQDTILELIFGAAEWMGPIPAPHIPGRQMPGGMFAHSLQVGMTALALSRIQNPPKTPYLYYDDPDAADLAWQLLALSCGLLRGTDTLGMIGKVQVVS
ncbi:MAG: hypothetical protein L0G27_05370, partial [Paracoccus sp. (in: a-proteobacteria)]|nr:hypothetical protein [Paracoccus sp. (in: a-proteobacteria)]